MKNIFFLFLAAILMSCNAQQTVVKSSITKETQQIFPASWEGNYTGNLEIYGVSKVKMQLKMQLKIAKKTDSLYNWTIIYEMKDKPVDVRAYELKVIDTKKGHYQIDEKNSIVIDAFLHNNIFTSFFKVMNSYIVAMYTQLDTETIVFEIISATNKKEIITGNTTVDGEKIPEVITNFVNGRQKAILKRVQ